jgi:hypothetical protein
MSLHMPLRLSKKYNSRIINGCSTLINSRQDNARKLLWKKAVSELNDRIYRVKSTTGRYMFSAPLINKYDEISNRRNGIFCANRSTAFKMKIPQSHSRPALIDVRQDLLENRILDVLVRVLLDSTNQSSMQMLSQFVLLLDCHFSGCVYHPLQVLRSTFSMRIQKLIAGTSISVKIESGRHSTSRCRSLLVSAFLLISLRCPAPSTCTGLLGS